MYQKVYVRVDPKRENNLCNIVRENIYNERFVCKDQR